VLHWQSLERGEVGWRNNATPSTSNSIAGLAGQTVKTNSTAATAAAAGQAAAQAADRPVSRGRRPCSHRRRV